MKKYILTGLYNKPCTQGGVKRYPAEGGRPAREEVVQVPFKPGQVVETDLDMRAAEVAGFIRSIADKIIPAAQAPANKPVSVRAPLTEKEQHRKDAKDSETKSKAEEKALAEEAEKKALEEAEEEAQRAEDEKVEQEASEKRRVDAKALAEAEASKQAKPEAKPEVVVRKRKKKIIRKKRKN